MLWRGDFHNARQLLDALARRIDRRAARGRDKVFSARERFHRMRQARAQRAQLLSMLLLPLETGYQVPLPRAPEVREACAAAFGPDEESAVIALRELQGVIAAQQWHEKGVFVPALEGRIHPHFGVFSPVRGEYVDLVAEAPLPAFDVAFDIGTGSGVLAAVLARRGVCHVVATDQDARAVACARDNLARLGVDERVQLQQTDLFPAGRAPLIVCNPPWLPGKPTSPLEHAVYDPGSRMLKGFVHGLPEHLTAEGEAWLVISDLAEHLELRSRDDLLKLFDAAGLSVLGRLETRPRHERAAQQDDPLHFARSREVTSLWRLALR